MRKRDITAKDEQTKNCEDNVNNFRKYKYKWMNAQKIRIHQIDSRKNKDVRQSVKHLSIVSKITFSQRERRPCRLLREKHTKHRF